MSYTPDDADMIKTPKPDQRHYLVIADVLQYPIRVIAVFDAGEDGEYHAMQTIQGQFKSQGGICCRRVLPRFVK